MENMKHKDVHLSVVSATELLNMEFSESRPVITRLMPRGTYIFAGAPKIGKSWMVLWFAKQISSGEPIWDFETTKGAVLYISLEDPARRLQNRLMEIADEKIGIIYFATESEMIGTGLEEQLQNFIAEHSDVSLIIIDTLQKIREISGDNYSYSSDYDVISAIKQIADRQNIAFLIVHHTRKEGDENDPFNTISGTNGLLGAADGAFVLMKHQRINARATFHATGRGIEDIKLELEFNRDNYTWTMLSHDDENLVSSDNPVLGAVDELLTKQGEKWAGTSTELLQALRAINGVIENKPNTLSRMLHANSDLLLTKFNICYSVKRVNNIKQINLYRGTDPTSDMCDILYTGAAP
jgi:Predicted ATP-dependent serine protease